MWMVSSSQSPGRTSRPTRRWRAGPAKSGRSTARSPSSSASATTCPYGELTSFPRAVQAKDDETVIFSWITYESRAQRDAVMAKVMADPRLKPDMENMPFDGKRMIFGGFEVMLEL